MWLCVYTYLRHPQVLNVSGDLDILVYIDTARFSTCLHFLIDCLSQAHELPINTNINAQICKPRYIYIIRST